MRSLTIVTKGLDMIAALLAGISSPEKSLEASDDGQNFRTIVKLPDGGAPEHTISFPPVTAKFFRVTFKRTPPPPLPAWLIGMDPAHWGSRLAAPPTDYDIAELVLHPGARVNRFEEKAAFTPLPDLYQFATPPVAPADAVAKVRCDRPDFEDARGRHARLDASRRPLGRPPLRLFAPGNHQPSGDRRGHGPGSRQAEPRLCEELHGTPTWTATSRR